MNNEKTKEKSYYAIIPAVVRYDKELTPNAKLLYGEITALSNEKGYCWANNAYFAELYNTSRRSITEWIRQLIDKKYIAAEVIYRGDSKYIIERRLIPIEENIYDIWNKTSIPYSENNPYPIEEHFQDNIKDNIKDNINYATSPAEELFLKLWQLYPSKKGMSYVSMKSKKNIYKIGMERMTKAIDNYKQELKQNTWKQPMNGSTFFNSRYEDYLPAEVNKDDVDKKGKIVFVR